MKDTEIEYLSLLNSYGDVVELDWEFDVDSIISQLSVLPWEPGTNGKRGINLTGPDSGLGLDAADKHDVNQPYTQHLKACPALTPFFDQWEHLARCRAVHLQAGSYFKMHRDAFRFNPQMRVFIPLNKTQVHEWNFVYDKELYHFKPGRAYVLNTRKQHGSFAMADDIYHVLLSIYLTRENLRTVMGMLPNCKEY